jgi:hypothetical protein
MKKVTNSQLDALYDAIDCLLKNGSFEFLDDVIKDKLPQIWRMDLDILLGWATVTLPAKSKLPSRKLFIETGKRYHPNKKLWKGLE